MTDLKELIEREIAGFLDWPGDNKNIVTTASAMLFAEHVAKLWAGHIADAGKMAAPAVQGEPVGEVRLDLGAPSVIYAELYSETLPSLAPGTKLYAAPHHSEQGEPVAVMYKDGSLLSKADCGDNFEICCKIQTPLYTAPQPVEPDEERLAMEAAMESVDPATWPGLTPAQRCALGRFAKPQPAAQEPAPDVAALTAALESLIKGYVRLLEAGMDRITSLGGDCDPVPVMEQNDPWLRDARAALAAHRSRGEV